MTDRITVAPTPTTQTFTAPGIHLTVEIGAHSSDLLALRRRLDALLGAARTSEAICADRAAHGEVG